MTEDKERLYLTFQELQALMYLGGKDSLFGFRAENAPISGQDEIWNACCNLMTDGLITQQDEKFRLRRDLHTVLQPVFSAEKAWVLMPGTAGFSQIIFFVAQRVCAMQKNGYGGYSLWSAEPEELPTEIIKRINSEEEFMPASKLRLEKRPNVQDDTQTLLEDSVFLLEQVQTATAKRLRWIRGVRRSGSIRLEWSEADSVCSEEMTDERLAKLLMADVPKGDS